MLRALSVTCPAKGAVCRSWRRHHLTANIDTAYSLMCEVFRLEPGDPLDTLRGRADIRRAELVEAGLALVERQLAPDAGTWTVEYREHGGFLATTSAGSDAQPSRFWGFAATPQSAAATVAGYFLDRPPTVRFDSELPAEPRPVVSFTVKADISPERPGIEDLLAERGEAYAEHIAACAAVRDQLAGRDLRRYLAEQAARLNATDPQLPIDSPTGWGRPPTTTAVASRAPSTGYPRRWWWPPAVPSGESSAPTARGFLSTSRGA